MSVSAGPSIQTDGLVFHYDSANSLKSWRGKPTVNYISNPTEEMPRGEFGQYRDLAPTFNTYGLVPYSLSMDIKANKDGGVYVYMQNGSSSKYNFVSANASATTEWQRFYFNNITPSISTPSDTAAILATYTGYGSGINPTVRNIQLELGSFATPFVDGTRSTAQAITDLTNNNTITASSLTYASDGTFSFVRANSNYLNISANTDTRFQNSYQTWSAWVNIASTGPNGYSELWNNGGNQGMTIQWRAGAIGFFIYNGAYLDYPVSVTNALNTWMNITCVIDNIARVMILYKNGALVGTSPQWSPYVPPNGGVHIGGNFATGNGGDFTQGNISNVQLYNRALSATEIQQNFNALRTRYGI